MRLPQSAIKRIEKEISRQLSSMIFTKSQENLVEMNAIDTGFLLKSGVFRERGGYYEVFYNCPYASFVEYGTRPHFPPPKAIEGWVRRKLGIKGKRAKSVARAICFKIAKYGTKPRPFLRNAVEFVRNALASGQISFKIVLKK